MYNHAKTVTALRKNTLRIDLHVHSGDEGDYREDNEMKSAINSILIAGIVKSLDVIGIVAHTGPGIGWMATQLVKENNYDIFVVPGQEYLCTDRYRFLVYNIKQPIPPNLPSQQVISWSRQNKGFVMAINLSKRQAQTLNKLKGTPQGVDAVEIYNPVTGAYRDLDIQYPKFVNSASKNASDLEKAEEYTLLTREELAQMGLMPQEQGLQYTPGYLQRADESNQGANPVAEGA